MPPPRPPTQSPVFVVVQALSTAPDRRWRTKLFSDPMKFPVSLSLPFSSFQFLRSDSITFRPVRLEHVLLCFLGLMP
ncbi:hypothetical protein KSP39_PZI003179 [Platanthera zijinensis]|uniref:Uncharacterized protein n=1 Tax=Platanthera zijinensis TaxID=2320716 RepID=A0AAP0BVU0_9ASPA